MLDTTFHEGRKDKPLAVFIHGLGMDKNVWSDPERSKVLAGRFPLDVLLRKRARPVILDQKPGKRIRITTGPSPAKLETLFGIFRNNGFSVVTWSQRRASSDAELAVSELRELLKVHNEIIKHGIILIGHSRGGLIAKRFSISEPGLVRAIISIGSPFSGSSLAKWASILSKTSFVLAPFLKNAQQSDVKSNINHVLQFINSKAVKELLPGSEFLLSIKTPLPRRVMALNIAGSSPTLLDLYGWHSDCIKNTKKYRSRPKLLFSFPDSMSKLLPDMIMPDELLKGSGDGLVSIESALSNRRGDSEVFSLNHAALLFSRSVHERVFSFIKEKVKL